MITFCNAASLSPAGCFPLFFEGHERRNNSENAYDAVVQVAETQARCWVPQIQDIDNELVANRSTRCCNYPESRFTIGFEPEIFLAVLVDL